MHLISRAFAERLRQVDPALVQQAKLDPADAHDVLARHLATLARRALLAVPGGDDKLARQIEVANRIAESIAQVEPYADRAITDRLFQWESQSTTSSASPTGQRYINHVARGSTVHLFVRESKVPDADLGAPPYLYAGPMTYVSHAGDRPMRIQWRLQHPLPADMYAAARAIAA